MISARVVLSGKARDAMRDEAVGAVDPKGVVMAVVPGVAAEAAQTARRKRSVSGSMLKARHWQVT